MDRNTNLSPQTRSQKKPSFFIACRMAAGRFIFFLSKVYGFDLRALALMRIAIALVLLADLFIRLTDLEAHYTAQGVWPAHMAESLGWKGGYWSIHTLYDTHEWQLVLFGIHILAAFGLLLGFRTTLSAFISWYLLVSLHNRNVFILQAGDDLLRIVLFLGMFLPWQQRFALQKVKPFFPPSVFTYLAYLILIACVYAFSACLKSSPEWRSEGTALYYALSLEQLRLPYTGDLLYTAPRLMKYFTWLVMSIEVLIPILILLPSNNKRFRNAAFILLVILHTGIALTLYVGLFPFISVAAAIGLLRFKKRTVALSYSPFSDTGFASAISLFGILCIALITMHNLQGLPGFPYQLKPGLQSVMNMVRLDQYWGMFSPSVLKKDGWFLYQGVDSSGKAWDLRLNQPGLKEQKPERILSEYKNDRWRKLAENLMSDNFTFLRHPYAKYKLHQWNKSHPQHKMKYFHLFYVEKTNEDNYKSRYGEKVLYCVSDGR